MNANKAFYSLLTLFIVSFTGFVTLLFKSLPLTLANTIYICQKVLAGNTWILPQSLPFLLAFVLTFVLAIGLFTLIFQVVKTRVHIKKSLSKRTHLYSKIFKTVQELNLDSKVDVVKDHRRFSFCYGLLKPRICLSTGLIKNLSSKELKAVLLHESYHLKNHDPLKIIIAKASSRMFFFIPTISDFQNLYSFSREIAADRLTVRSGAKNQLLSALSKVMVSSSPQFSGVAGLVGNTLEKRILYLTGRNKNLTWDISKPRLLLSLSIVIFSFSMLTIPVHAFNSTMSMQSSNQSYFVCPFGDKCATECNDKIKNQEINFSQSLPYTPVR